MSFWRNLFTSFPAFRTAIKTGFMPFHLLGTGPQFNDYTKDADKIKAIFSNPALLKVFALQCDLFSMGKPYVYNKSGKEVPDDPAIDRINNPNPMQSRADWLWCYMFWKMCGNAYLYTTSKLVERENAPMYWLENHKIEWPASMDKEKDKLILSTAKHNRLLETEILYRYEDGTTQEIKLKEILHIADLSNGTGNWFKGFSKLDSLYKVITNSEAALDSNNINIRYAGKFLVAGTANPNDISKKIMGEDEKEDIEAKANGDKQVHAVKSMIDIKRFVDDLKVMELDKTYLAQFFLIGSHYNIPRDILELYTSSTFENQEKAMARHVNYTMEPAGEALGDDLAKHWEYKKGWRICFGWDHLPFTQVFEKERVAIKEAQARVLTALLKLGVPINEINVYLDTNFTIDEAAREAANSGTNQTASAGKRSQEINGSNYQ